MRAQGNQEARIVAITGYGQKQDQDNTAQAEFDAHLVKPVDTGRFRAILAKARATS